MSSPSGIAVVIPTLNEAAGIAAVIGQLLDGVPADRDVRLYVADGGSWDATAAIVTGMARNDARICWVDNPQRLQSAAVNLVANQVRDWAEILIRCDAHAGYPPGFVMNVASAIARSGADSVVVPMDSVGTSCIGRAIAWVSDTPAGSGGSAHRGGMRSGFVDHGHHAGWRLASFLAVGGYDQTYSHNEDAELDCRLNRSGFRVWLEADIRLTYWVRPTFRALARQYRNYGKGRSRTVRRHPGTIRARQLAVPSFVAANLLALLLAPWNGWTLLLPLGYLLALAAVSVQVAWRRRSRCGLLAGPAALVMHVAWAAGFVQGLVTVREPRWQASHAT
ncbi:MAG TPA: glycosyltransferase family 2 protein [Sphingomonas sp.]|jgi:succinoglycan biosynthesis protein ExoA|uniref:glycosyltransferase family 2 protein n=1 Tax=Sphingomonas sp. TaxID=28214 RepID=UPI002ED8042E